MKRFSLFILSSCAAIYGQFAPDETSRLSYSISAFAGTAERKIEARNVYLNTYGTKGQAIKRDLFVVFDPASGYFIFTYQGLGGMEGAAELDDRSVVVKRSAPSEAERASTGAFISARGMLLATAGYTGLAITQSDRKASALDDAERRAIAALDANVLEATRLPIWPAPKGGGLVQDEKSLLDRDFFFPPMSAMPSQIKIIGIAESPDGWEITLQGQYKARITLSLGFRPLKAERID